MSLFPARVRRGRSGDPRQTSPSPEATEKELTSAEVAARQWAAGTWPRPRLYHYTSTTALWSILSAQELWLPHARFGTDARDLHAALDDVLTSPARLSLLGTESTPAEPGADDAVLPDSLGEANLYRLCLSESDLVLSLWRRHGPDGVAVELELTGQETLTALSHGLDDPGGAFARPAHGVTGGEAMPLSAWQLRPVAYHHSDDDSFALGASIMVTGDEFWRASQEGADGDATTAPADNPAGTSGSERAAHLVTWIKQAALAEEKEWRLVVELPPGRSDQVSALTHYDPDRDGLPRPGLRLRFGSATTADDHGPYLRLAEPVGRAWAKHHGVGAAWRRLLAETVAAAFPATKLKLVPTDAGQPPYAAHVGPGPDARLVFDWIDQELAQLEPGDFGLSAGPGDGLVRVWSDGHVPIRSIVIGPQRDAASLEATLNHLRTTQWWLRHVTIRRCALAHHM